MTELPDIYLSLDKILEDPKAARLYLQGVLRVGNVDLAITVIQSIINAEKQKFSYRLDALEKRADEIEKRIAALEQVQVTRQEFDELKGRVEGLEKALRRGLAEVIVRI